VTGRLEIEDNRYLSLSDDALLAQCGVDVFRSHGPGGQKRNKTSSGLRLRHHPTGLVVTAREDRSQHVNKARAVRRLRKAIALHARRSIDLQRYTPSSTLACYVGRDGRISISIRNPEYSGIVQEVLDVFAACGMKVRAAADSIGVTTSHLVQLFQRDPALWKRVNEMRGSAGYKTLR